MRSSNIYPQVRSWQYQIQLYKLSSFNKRRHFQKVSSCRSRPDFVEETIQVPIGANGSVALSILQPVQPPGHARVRPNVVLHLPPGGIFDPIDSTLRHGNGKDHTDVKTSPSLTVYSEPGIQFQPKDLSFRQTIASTTAATVVTIHYRLGCIPQESSNLSLDVPDAPINAVVTPSTQRIHFYKYPTPVHDTLAGYDWIIRELQPENIGVFGRNIGGSLALMLALTESRTIQAVVAHNPVCDWVGLDEYCSVSPKTIEKFREYLVKSKNRPMKDRDEESQIAFLSQLVRAQNIAAAKHRKGASPPDLVPLLKAREAYFDSPAKYFDSFASPILFLRSAGRDCPRQMSKYLTGSDHPVPVLKAPERYKDLFGFWEEYLDDGLITEKSSGNLQAGLVTIDEGNTSSAESDLVRRLGSRRRKALSRWPPYGLGDGVNAPSWANYGIDRLNLTLPLVRISTTHDDSPEIIEQENSSSDEVVSGLSNLGLDPSVDGVDSRMTTMPETSLGKGKRRSARGHKPHSKKRTVLGDQAEEMVSVMRRACFWSTENDQSEARVQLVRLPGQKSEGGHEHHPGADLHSPDASVLKQAGPEVERNASEWFNKVFADGNGSRVE